VTQAARAVGVLVAEGRLVTPRLNHLDAGPVGLQLVGDDHRNAGAHTLTHLRAMTGDRHGAVVTDRHEHPRIVDRSMRHRVRAVLLLLRESARGQAHRQHQRAGARVLQKTPAA